MGLSSSKTTTVNKPSEQQLQAGNVLNSAFQSQMPKIQAYADQIGGLIPSMMAKYQAGNTGVNAAQNWVSNTLQNGGTNPYLQQMIDMTGNDTARAINANMGTRGLMGGSVQQKILAEQLAKQSLGLRYNDWNSAQQRQMQAAGLAPRWRRLTPSRLPRCFRLHPMPAEPRSMPLRNMHRAWAGCLATPARRPPRNRSHGAGAA